jgi:hypothetical protein
MKLCIITFPPLEIAAKKHCLLQPMLVTLYLLLQAVSGRVDAILGLFLSPANDFAVKLHSEVKSFEKRGA